MPSLAVIPAWVTPTPRDVQACHERAHSLARYRATTRPIAATLDWAMGNHFSPVSGRWIEPTERAARAEMMLASSVYVSGRGLADDLWAELGIEPAESVTANSAWLASSSATLSWLLGIQGRPPLPLTRT